MFYNANCGKAISDLRLYLKQESERTVCTQFRVIYLKDSAVNIITEAGTSTQLMNKISKDLLHWGPVVIMIKFSLISNFINQKCKKTL